MNYRTDIANALLAIDTEEPAEQLIRVLPFEAAPKALQELSKHGGDEDWLAVVPETLRDAYIPWLGSNFGCCDVSKHPLPDGSVVYIGTHA